VDVTGTLRDRTANGYRYVVTATAAPPRLDIRLLGPPEIFVDGAPLVVDTRKAVAILALLGAEGRAFARDELAALLWPDADEPAAHGALRRTLSTLRAATGDTVLVDRTRVALAPAGVRVDVAELERLAGSDARCSLAAAAALARGPFLAGFNLRDSADFDDWRAARAVALERTVMTVLDRLSTAHETAGDQSAAIGVASRRLDLDPLDEAGHVRLMDLFVRSGDRGAARRQYRLCVASLDRELGVAPLESTTARYEALRDADVPVEPPTTTSPPAVRVAPYADEAAPSATALVGRDVAMDELLTAYGAMSDGRGRIAAITGEAGIGKTRLGEALVDQIRSRGGTVLEARAYVGERGIAYGPIVELLRSGIADPGAMERLQASGVRPELARLLPAVDPGRRPSRASADGPGAHARLVSAIAEGLTALIGRSVPGCLWIDDLAWADGATLEALAYLVPRLAGRPVFVLLSWRPEDLDETTAAVVGRLVAPPALVVELGRFDRVAVAELAAPATSDPAVIDRLLEASEGLPLYVVEALAAGDLALATMPLGVRAVLRARLATARETAAQVLAAASVIGRSFDLATVRHASGRSEGETVDALDESLRRGLIREAGAGFDFAHGGLRDLAYESTSLTRRRLLHRRVAEALRLDLAGSGRNDLSRLTLIAAHERDGGRTAEAAEAFRLAGARAAAIFATREAIDHDETALALGHPDVAGLRGAIGRLRTRLGDYAGAITALEAAAAAADDTDLPEIERLIAGAQLRRGDLVAAARHLEAALDGATNPASVARILVDQSVVLRLGGDLPGALGAARRALNAATEAQDAAGVGAAHRSLGLIALDSGDPEAARVESRRAVDAGDPTDPAARIAALTGLALAEAGAGDVEAGLRHGAAAVELCRQIGDRHLEGAVENHLADILHAARREDDAMVHLRRAVEAFAEVGGDPIAADAGIWMLSAS
jgi:DNA-binding SARP family transcriptional activator/tetratricopeptide (TPR) repeat protein